MTVTQGSTPSVKCGQESDTILKHILTNKGFDLGWLTPSATNVFQYSFWSQSVHGRTRACHARRRGSLPLGTAKFIDQLTVIRAHKCPVASMLS